jgi:hypothetical protein
MYTPNNSVIQYLLYSSAIYLTAQLCSIKLSNIRILNVLSGRYQFLISNSSINDVIETNIVNGLFYSYPIPKALIPR